MHNFLKSVLPHEGVYFLATPNQNGRGFKHTAFDSINEMATNAMSLDATIQTVYFGCASYQFSSYKDTDGRIKYRTQQNAAWARAFWMDIDCSESKCKSGEGYATKKEALNALGNFCLAIGVKMPTIVDSGGGIHAYFILDTDVEKVFWNETANKLKSLTNSLSFLVDNSRTTDIASVLRPVGTHNRKVGRDVKVVELKHASEVIAWDSFRSLINLAYKKYCMGPKKHKSNTSTLIFSKESETQLNIERIKSALSYIDPNCDRQLWRNICFAIHALDWTCSKDLALHWSKGDYL